MSTLLTNLVAYWKLEEAAGTSRFDQVGGFTLSDNGTVTQGTGIIGNCAVFNGSSQWLATPDAVNLRQGNEKSFSVWVKFSTLPTGNDTSILAKRTSLADLEYLVFYDHTAQRFTYGNFDGSTF